MSALQSTERRKDRGGAHSMCSDRWHSGNIDWKVLIRRGCGRNHAARGFYVVFRVRRPAAGAGGTCRVGDLRASSGDSHSRVAGYGNFDATTSLGNHEALAAKDEAGAPTGRRRSSHHARSGRWARLGYSHSCCATGHWARTRKPSKSCSGSICCIDRRRRQIIWRISNPLPSTPALSTGAMAPLLRRAKR
jgi:hypothetical protein